MSRILRILVATACCAAGQSFEVGSIHTRTDGSGEVWTIKPFRFDVSGSRLAVENFSLKDLITYAYDVKDYQLLGEPHWADIDRYDINAKAEGDAALTRDLARPMMQAMLADRFQLKVHHGTKEMPVYALVIAKGGPKFKESAPDAESILRLASPGKGAVMTVTKGSMAQLASQFSNRNGVDRPVLDKTGLTGGYDYKLEWGDYGAASADADVVSIFTAIQEQLGLKLEKTTAPIEVLIVDSAAKPSGN